MFKPRLQVLVPLALAAAGSMTASMACAQPMDAPGGISAPGPEKVLMLPLLPLSAEDWIQRNGGLTRLKLKMQDASAREIADEVKQQTGLDIKIDDDVALPAEAPPRFSVEATGQPFWEAIAGWKRGERALGLRASGRSGPWALSAASEMGAGARVSAGPCLLIASNLSLSKTANLSAQNQIVDASRRLNIGVAVHIDPRFLPQVLASAPQIDGAVDDRGREIASSRSAQLSWASNAYQPGVTLSLLAPEGDATSLRSVRGRLRLAVATASERWEIDVAKTPVAQKSFKSEASKVTARFEGLETVGDGWLARFSFERRSMGGLRIFKSRDGEWSGELGSVFQIPNSISILNAAGIQMENQGGHAHDSFGNGVRKSDIEARIAQAPTSQGAPAKIIIDIPLEWREVQIPFEFKDLPLP